MKTISLKLEDGLERRLAVAAQGLGASKSDLVRTAIEAFLADGKASPTGSCLGLAGDLVGCVDAPADLSVNRRHMKGFGQ